MTLEKGDQRNVEVFESDAALDRLTTGGEDDETAQLMVRLMNVAHEAIASGDKEPGRLGAEMAAVGRFLRQWVIDTEPKLLSRQMCNKTQTDKS